jgi:Transposase DDE domain
MQKLMRALAESNAVRNSGLSIKPFLLWADAAFAKPEIYEALEQLRVKYAIRLSANDNLLRDISNPTTS